MSNWFPLDADVAGLGTHFEKHWYKYMTSKPGEICICRFKSDTYLLCE